MELAKTLIRSCVRAFYDTKHVLVIDALMIHNALRDDDLSYLMCMNTKELHKLCGRLKEDRFLSVFNRQEFRDGQQRPLSKTYYYIDFRATIDAIKWRVYSIDKDVQGTTKPQDEITEYSCRRCKSNWTVMAVLSYAVPAGFLCPKCEFLLERDTGENMAGHEQSTKLNAQFRFITDMLPRIDSEVIPANDFQKAFEIAVPVRRDATNPAYESAPIESTGERPTAVKGMAMGPERITVTLTTGEGPTEKDLAEAAAKKAQHSAQNALPMHFTHSTITGEQVKFGDRPTPSLPGISSAAEDDKKTLGGSLEVEEEAGIDDYFAQLKAEQAAQLRVELEDEEGSSEDEEDEFEDVLTGSGAATPALSEPMVKSSSNGLNGGHADDGRPLKKVKIEDNVGGLSGAGEDIKKIKVEEDGDGESDEDLEFEDV